jgi:hypothetical protein
VTVRIELESRCRRLEHRLPAVPLEAERGKPPFDLGTVRHDVVDVARQVEASRPEALRGPRRSNDSSLGRVAEHETAAAPAPGLTIGPSAAEANFSNISS